MSDFLATQELREFARGLEQAGASIRALNMAASPHMLRNKDYELDIVRVGAALYGQQETVPGTRSAARWLSRIATLKKVSAQMWHSSRFVKACAPVMRSWRCFRMGLPYMGSNRPTRAPGQQPGGSAGLLLKVVSAQFWQ